MRTTSGASGSSLRSVSLADLFSPRSDYNFAPDGNECVPVGPEAIPEGSCVREDDEFKGSSGFRLIPGNTCDIKRGIKKDEPIMKPCHAAKETPGLITHQVVRRLELS